MFTVVEADLFTVEPVPDLDYLLPESKEITRRRNSRSISAVLPGKVANIQEFMASVHKAREVFHASEDLAELLGCQPDELCHGDDARASQEPNYAFTDTESLKKAAALLESTFNS